MDPIVFAVPAGPAAAIAPERPIVLALNTPRALKRLLKAPETVTSADLSIRGWSGLITTICNKNFVDIRTAASSDDRAECLLEAARSRGVKTVENLLDSEKKKKRKQKARADRLWRTLILFSAVVLTLAAIWDVWSILGKFEENKPTDIHPILYRALHKRPHSVTEAFLDREEWEDDVIKICDLNKISQPGDTMQQKCRRILNLISSGGAESKAWQTLVVESVTFKILYFIGSNLVTKILTPMIIRLVDNYYIDDDEDD